LITHLGSQKYLFAALGKFPVLGIFFYSLLFNLGDGHLLTYEMHVDGLKNRRKMALATQPMTLVPFSLNNENHVFAASDRPLVIYSGNNQKLLFSNLNIKVR
jgi:hypothetical protein